MGNVVALVAALVLGPLSDRLASRRPLLLASTLVALIAWGLLATANSMTIAVAAWALTGAGPLALVFAMLRDMVTAAGNQRGRVMGVVRTGFAIGWMGGPPFAGIAVDAVGFRGTMAGVAAVYACALVFTWFSIEDVAYRSVPAHATVGVGERNTPVLVLVTLATALSYGAQTSHQVYLPLYIEKILGQSATVVGFILAVTVLVELPAMPLIGKLADRVGLAPVYAAGLAVHALYFTVLAFIDTTVGVVLVQPLASFGAGCLETCALLLLLEALPNSAGVVTALTQVAFRGGVMIMSPLLGWLLEVGGWPLPFVASAIAEVIACAFIIAIAISGRREAPSRLQEPQRGLL